MLIITAKEKENIDRMIKRYKKKVEKVGLIKEVRKRIEYKKPSKRRREEISKAIYRERFKRENQ